MRLHEIMGIEQSRNWGVCSLNDFRKALGLKRKLSSSLFRYRILMVMNSVLDVFGMEPGS